MDVEKEAPVVISINKIGHIKDELKNMSMEERVRLLRQIAEEEAEKKQKEIEAEENNLETIPAKMKAVMNEMQELRKELRDIRREVKLNAMTSFDIKCREIITDDDDNGQYTNYCTSGSGSVSGSGSCSSITDCEECPFGWWGIMIFFFLAMVIFSIFENGAKVGSCPIKLHFD